MNVQFNYLYRDASNYKSWGSIIFAESHVDVLNPRRWELELRRLFLDDTFAAYQIALPEVFTFSQGKAGDDDHCLHEFHSIELTNELPNDAKGRTFSEFLSEVRTASAKGWEGFDPAAKSRQEGAFRFQV